MYKRLKGFVSRADTIDKIKTAIANKVVNQTAKQLQIPMKDAMCILVLDDFWNDLKVKAKGAWHNVKEFVGDNKHMIYSLISNLIGSAIPGAKPILDAVGHVYGGHMQS